MVSAIKEKSQTPMQTETWQPELVHDTVGTGDAEEVTRRFKDEGASHRQRLGAEGGERSDRYVPGLGPRPPDSTSMTLCCRTYHPGSPLNVKGQTISKHNHQSS